MRAKNKNHGYTIVEVMIFLAVSSLMFIMAASAVSGKQAKAQFQQGAQQTNEEFRRVINDVDNGYFPSTSDFQCLGTASGPQFNKTLSKEQGANKDCVFIGKVIHFSPSNNKSTYNIYTLAANQFRPGGTSNLDTPASYAEAMPKVVYSSASGVDLTERDKIYPWSLELANSVGHYGGSSDSIAGIAVIKSLGSSSGSGLSGGQDVSIIPIRSIDIGGSTASADSMINYLNGASARTWFDNSKNINFRSVMCLTDGSQYAAITVGDLSGQRQSTGLKIGKSTTEAGC